MRTLEAEEAFGNWRKLERETRSEPVKVVGAAGSSMIVMSEAEYRRLKGQAWDRLTVSIDRVAAEAAAAGLTPRKLDELLADES